MRKLFWCAGFFLFSIALLEGDEDAAKSLYDFGPWPAKSSPQEIGERLTERFLKSEHLNWGKQNPFIVYPEACTWYGALSFSEKTGNKAATQRLAERFAPLLEPKNYSQIPPLDHVDSCVFGIVPLELYRQTKKAYFRQLGLQIADGQWDNPRSDGLTNQTRFWIDDMFMITALQVQAYRATGNRQYIDRAANEMAVYVDKLQQPNGLFYHAPEVHFYWGRGNGWVAAGMAELLRSLPLDHPKYATIMSAYKTMMASLLANQSPEGMWRQLIDEPESWPEVSCSGMFTFAFVTGVKNGWLDSATYGPAARKAWLALITYINDDGAVREVCIGTNKKNDYQYYLDRPRAVGDLHGQAAVLWSAGAFLSVNR